MSSHVRPSRTRPVIALLVPPHCLKKNFTPDLRQRSRIARAHSIFIGRAPGPDSPPTITQSSFDQGNRETGPIKGSTDKNLTFALVLASEVARCATLASSTLVPIQTFFGHSINGFSFKTRSGRLVRT